MGFNKDIKDVMTECQSGNHNTKTLITRMTKLFKDLDKKEFESTFIFCLKKFLIVQKREPQVDRGLDFISKFVASLKVEKKAKEPQKPKSKKRKPSSEEEEEEEEEEEMHPFQIRIFNFLIKHHSASSKAVRFRCCQIVNMLLSDLGEGAQIDGVLFDDIYDMMLERVRDLSHLVRTQAVLGMRRLQEPENPQCAIIDVYLRLLSQDKNQDVRRAVLGSIAVTHKTLKPILKRTRDVNEHVRRLAYKVVAEKVHIKAMPIAHRVTLIKRGLNDRSELVKDTCVKVLVKAWLGVLDDDLLKLLDCLDCQNYSAECQKLLSTLMQSRDPATLVSEFDILDERRCIPVDKLTKENALMWRCLCKHLQSLGSEHEELLERLLPTCVSFVDYLKGIMNRKKDDDDLYEESQNSFILQQILVIMRFLDFSDEAGRRAILGVVRKLLLDENTSEDIIKHLVDQVLCLHGEDEVCLELMTEIISDIQQPIASEENVVVEMEKRRKLEIRLAELKVELMHLQDVLEDSITKQDFSKAAEVKSNMEDLEKQKNQVERELSGRQGDSEEPEGPSQVTRSQPKEDPTTLTRCLMIIQEVLSGVRFNKLNPFILSFINMLIIPGITSPSSVVRNLAIKCLGLCCLRDPKKVGQYLMIFMQATMLDTEEIRVTGFRSMFNFLHFFGFPAVAKAVTNEEIEEARRGSDAGDDEKDGTARADDDDVGTNLLDHMTKNLDNESSAIRTVCAEGLSKLLLSSRVSSPSLLARLLLLWYNPMTEEDTRMRHCLGAFFPCFAYSSRANQEMIGEAFLPTLKTLLDAPSSSPLSRVKVANVAELMVHLSNFRHQRSKVKEKINKDEMPLMDKCPHDDIAVAICNEILTDPNAVDKVRLYARSLLMLELTPSNDYLLKSLQVLAEKMAKEVKDKTNKNYLLKFFMSVYETLEESKETSQLDDTVVVVRENDPAEEHISSVVSSASVTKEIDESVAKETTESQESNRLETSMAAKESSSSSVPKRVVKGHKASRIGSSNSSDDFEAPSQPQPTRKSLSRKVKDTAIRKQLVKKRKRNQIVDDDEEDDNSSDRKLKEKVAKKPKTSSKDFEVEDESEDDIEDASDDNEDENDILDFSDCDDD